MCVCGYEWILMNDLKLVNLQVLVVRDLTMCAWTGVGGGGIKERNGINLI